MMELYKKPVVLLNEELSEGVYAASGNVVDEPTGGVTGGGATGGVSVSGVTLTEQGNEYNKVNKYKVTIKNSGSAEASSWSASVSVTSGTATSVVVYNNWQASASLNGSTITIVPGGGGSIPAGGSIDVEVVVFYSSNSVTVA